MTEMARPYKREEDKVIIDNIDSILEARRVKEELLQTKLEYVATLEQLEKQITRAEKMLIQLNGRLEMTIQNIKTQNNNCVINNYYRKDDTNEEQRQYQRDSSENEE